MQEVHDLQKIVSVCDELSLLGLTLSSDVTTASEKSDTTLPICSVGETTL